MEKKRKAVDDPCDLCPCPDAALGKDGDDQDKQSQHGMAAGNDGASSSNESKKSQAENDDFKALERWRNSAKVHRNRAVASTTASSVTSASSSSSGGAAAGTDTNDSHTSGTDNLIEDFPGTMTTKKAHSIGAAENLWQSEDLGVGKGSTNDEHGKSKKRGRDQSKSKPKNESSTWRPYLYFPENDATSAAESVATSDQQQHKEDKKMPQQGRRPSFWFRISNKVKKFFGGLKRPNGAKGKAGAHRNETDKGPKLTNPVKGPKGLVGSGQGVFRMQRRYASYDPDKEIDPSTWFPEGNFGGIKPMLYSVSDDNGNTDTDNAQKRPKSKHESSKKSRHSRSKKKSRIHKSNKSHGTSKVRSHVRAKSQESKRSHGSSKARSGRSRSHDSLKSQGSSKSRPRKNTSHGKPSSLSHSTNKSSHERKPNADIQERSTKEAKFENHSSRSHKSSRNQSHGKSHKEVHRKSRDHKSKKAKAGKRAKNKDKKDKNIEGQQHIKNPAETQTQDAQAHKQKLLELGKKVKHNIEEGSKPPDGKQVGSARLDPDNKLLATLSVTQKLETERKLREAKNRERSHHE